MGLHVAPAALLLHRPLPLLVKTAILLGLVMYMSLKIHLCVTWADEVCEVTPYQPLSLLATAKSC